MCDYMTNYPRWRIHVQLPHRLRRRYESIREKDEDRTAYTSSRNPATVMQLFD